MEKQKNPIKLLKSICIDVETGEVINKYNKEYRMIKSEKKIEKRGFITFIQWTNICTRRIEKRDAIQLTIKF